MNDALIKEIPRKMLHLSSTIIPLSLFFVKKGLLLIILGILAFIFLSIDIARLNISGIRELFIKFFGAMLRHHELFSVTGATYVLLSAFLSILLFPKTIAILSLLFLTVCDTVAAIFGISLGKIYFSKHKTIAGTLSFFLSAIILSLFITNIPFWIKLSGVIVATIVEAFPLAPDDNLSVPLISGTVMSSLILI